MHRAYLTLKFKPKVDKSETEKAQKPSRQDEVANTSLQGIFFVFTDVVSRIDTRPRSFIGS